MVPSRKVSGERQRGAIFLHGRSTLHAVLRLLYGLSRAEKLPCAQGKARPQPISRLHAQYTSGIPASRHVRPSGSSWKMVRPGAGGVSG